MNKKRLGPGLTGLFLQVMLLAMLLLAAVGFTACGLRSGSEEVDTETESSTTSFRIYVLNKNGTKLSYWNYTPEQEDPLLLIKELLHQLKAVPEDIDQVSAIPEAINTDTVGIRQDGLIVSLSFDNNYLEIARSQEVLARAAIVKTLTQISDIDAVIFYVGEEMLSDSFGNPIGAMRGPDFIEQISEDPEREMQTVTLYFANAEGTGLVRETREVTTSAVVSLERAVLMELVAGPHSEGARQTLVPDVEISSVLTKDQIAYVNFDGTFLSSSMDLNPQLVIYSIVNSLTELSTVNKVQISVDGVTSIVYMNAVSLENPLERNLDLRVTETPAETTAQATEGQEGTMGADAETNSPETAPADAQIPIEIETAESSSGAPSGESTAPSETVAEVPEGEAVPEAEPAEEPAAEGDAAPAAEPAP